MLNIKNIKPIPANQFDNTVRDKIMKQRGEDKHMNTEIDEITKTAVYKFGLMQIVKENPNGVKRTIWIVDHEGDKQVFMSHIDAANHLLMCHNYSLMRNNSIYRLMTTSGTSFQMRFNIFDLSKEKFVLYDDDNLGQVISKLNSLTEADHEQKKLAAMEYRKRINGKE